MSSNQAAGSTYISSHVTDHHMDSVGTLLPEFQAQGRTRQPHCTTCSERTTVQGHRPDPSGSLLPTLRRLVTHTRSSVEVTVQHALARPVQHTGRRGHTLHDNHTTSAQEYISHHVTVMRKGPHPQRPCLAVGPARVPSIQTQHGSQLLSENVRAALPGVEAHEILRHRLSRLLSHHSLLLKPLPQLPPVLRPSQPPRPMIQMGRWNRQKSLHRHPCKALSLTCHPSPR
mmetsp:Transcript_62777/g.168421  ORF Transcript_62777/g.168421 Transcript_62777/m.168421 type:complete len:229 (+) Transcript_62777:104-790(+)